MVLQALRVTEMFQLFLSFCISWNSLGIQVNRGFTGYKGKETQTISKPMLVADYLVKFLMDYSFVQDLFLK